MRRAALTIAALSLVLATLPAAAHTGVGDTCEGAYGFDHGIRSDGGGWYHNLTRYINADGDYTAIRNHYVYTITGYLYKHRTVRNNCGSLGEAD